MTVVDTRTAGRAARWQPPSGRPASLDAIPLPPQRGLAGRAWRHRRAMHYNRLIGLMVVVNLAVAGVAWRAGWFDPGSPELRHLAAVAQANFVVASLPRQQWMINAVGWLATRPGHGWPLRVRWVLGKYYHLGGLHVGAALAGSLWYATFVGGLVAAYAVGDEQVSGWNVAVSGVIVGVLAAMVAMALPEQRRLHHDRFEVSHRIGAWSVLALVWANTLVLVTATSDGASFGEALVASPTVWLLGLTTWFALWPWLLLRRVPVSVEKPSDHVAIAHLAHDTPPAVGTTRPISRHPLIGWHHFGCVPSVDDRPGYRMAISRAGDWTSEFIDDPPSHVWVRGLPAVGVANVRRLFRRVVFVATGSGIGPALSHLLESGDDCRLVWITRDPARTYGDGLVGEILTAQPDAVIWNTDERGKPDVLRLAHGVAVEFGAEAVICISNKAVTWTVVEGLEQRGIPAFGPIWDS